MQAIVIIDPKTGKATLTVPTGAEFPEAKAAIDRLAAILKTNGIAIDVEKVEQHSHGPKVVNVVHTQKAGL